MGEDEHENPKKWGFPLVQILGDLHLLNVEFV